MRVTQLLQAGKEPMTDEPYPEGLEDEDQQFISR